MPIKKKPLILCDLDGTLCDISHRVHHVRGRRKDWKRFFGGVSGDAINHVVADILKRYAHTHAIVFLSGRPEQCRMDTLAWLAEHAGLEEPTVFMRAEGDFRPDDIVKSEIFERDVKPKFGEPFFILDDRDKVVKMWRSKGFVCLQVAEGDF